MGIVEDAKSMIDNSAIKNVECGVGIKHAMFDLTYEMRKNWNKLAKKAFEDHLGRELQESDLDRLSIMSYLDSETDLLAIDGQQVGKIEYVNDGVSIRLELYQPDH